MARGARAGCCCRLSCCDAAAGCAAEPLVFGAAGLCSVLLPRAPTHADLRRANVQQCCSLAAEQCLAQLHRLLLVMDFGRRDSIARAVISSHSITSRVPAVAAADVAPGATFRISRVCGAMHTTQQQQQPRAHYPPSHRMAVCEASVVSSTCCAVSTACLLSSTASRPPACCLQYASASAHVTRSGYTVRCLPWKGTVCTAGPAECRGWVEMQQHKKMHV